MLTAIWGEGVDGREWASTARRWGWFAGIFFLAMYTAWAMAGDPRSSDIWHFSKPGGMNGGGWLLPAPGLAQMMIGAVVLYAALSAWAFRITSADAGAEGKSLIKGLPMEGHRLAMAHAVPAAVLLGGLIVRLQALAAGSVLIFDPQHLAAPEMPPASGWRWLGLLAEMTTLTILLLAQFRLKRTLWVAALYAFHPLALLGTASGAWQIWAALGLAVIGGLGWRLKPWAAHIILIASAPATVVWIARQQSHNPFNGILAEWLHYAGIDGNARTLWLTSIAFALQTAVVALATWRRWSLAKSLAHILVVLAITNPNLMPMDLLPIVPLVLIGWSAAAWVLSGTVLLLYGIAWSWEPGNPWAAPEWMMYAITTPAIVVLLAEWWEAIRTPAQTSN